MKEATKEEFEIFLENYPNPLNKDVVMICEPPMLQYNDFSLGDWPKSVVAQVKLLETYNEPNKYWILI